MKAFKAEHRMAMSIPLMMAAASCVPSGSASIASVQPAYASLVRPDSAPETPEWAKLDPGMPYRVFDKGVEAAKPFVDEARSQDDQLRSLDCLAQAVYYEARSESEDGQRAVAQVVLNRVRHPAFPNTICGVVYQGSNLGTGCQFTFTCDGSLSYHPVGYAWARARRIAAEMLSGDVYAPIGNATHYHTTAILPYWAATLTRAAVVGAHVFYRLRGDLGAPDAFTQRYAGLEPTPQSAAIQYEQEPKLAEAPAEIQAGVRKWKGMAFAGVRVHRGSEILAAAPEQPSAGAQPASAETESQAAAPAAESGSFGVQVHRSSDAQVTG